MIQLHRDRFHYQFVFTFDLQMFIPFKGFISTLSGPIHDDVLWQICGRSICFIANLLVDPRIIIVSLCLIIRDNVSYRYTYSHMLKRYLFLFLFQVIPTSSVLKHISSFDDSSRPYCIVALIDLAETFATKLSFTHGPDSGLQLCKSLLLLVHWLLLNILKCLQKLQEGKQHQELVIIENASNAVLKILEKSTVIALLQISRSEVTGQWCFCIACHLKFVLFT